MSFDYSYLVIGEDKFCIPQTEIFLNKMYVRSQKEEILSNSISDRQRNLNCLSNTSYFDVILAALPKEPITVIDIGGYIGSFSISMIRALNRLEIDWHLKCFEPSPLSDCIKETFSLNEIPEQAEVIQKAISNQNSILSYYAKPNNLISGRMYNFSGSEKKFDIQCSTLSEELSTDSNSINIIKIDTEGHEVEVLEGLNSEKLNEKAAIIFLEVWPWLAKRTLYDKPYFNKLLEDFFIIDLDAWTHPKFSTFVKPDNVESVIKNISSNNRSGCSDWLLFSKQIISQDEISNLLSKLA